MNQHRRRHDQHDPHEQQHAQDQVMPLAAHEQDQAREHDVQRWHQVMRPIYTEQCGER